MLIVLALARQQGARASKRAILGIALAAVVGCFVAALLVIGRQPISILWDKRVRCNFTAPDLSGVYLTEPKQKNPVRVPKENWAGFLTALNSAKDISHYSKFSVRSHGMGVLLALDDQRELYLEEGDTHGCIWRLITGARRRRILECRALGRAAAKARKALQAKSRETAGTETTTEEALAANESTKKETWGEAAEGVQVRLRADKKVWTFGEVPTFEADVRNNSKSEMHLLAWEYTHCYAEIDGVWYLRGIAAIDSLTPGRSVNGIHVRLTDLREEADYSQELRLARGKHVVRVGFQMLPRRSPDKDAGFRAVSNPVEITIEPAVPGSKLSIEEAVKGEFAFAAVCEALVEPTPVVGSFTGRSQTLARQQFKVLKALGGVSTPNHALELLYAYVHDSRAQERPLKKGERVIWIVRQARGATTVWLGFKALPDTPENRKAVIEGVKKDAYWGPVSNGLQCRLLPLEQMVQVTEGQKPEDIEVYVTYELRNVGEKPAKFFRWHTPLDKDFVCDIPHVVGPDGQSVRYLGPHTHHPGEPGREDFISVAFQHTYSHKFRLRFDFTRPGAYRISSSTGGQAHWYGWATRRYYGGDAEKAKQNPDNVWTGTLKSNTVTVKIVRPPTQPGR